jgi:Cu(I)/Ag(I) efflux system membrane fusion protein
MKPMLSAALLFGLVAACGKSAPTNEHAGHVPEAAAKPVPDEHAQHGSPAAHSEHGAMPEGYAEIHVADDKQQLIGVRTALAEHAAMGGAIRASALVEADEKRIAHVHSKLMGWIQDLYVNTVGQKVTKGQPLYSIYSQELLVAEEELLRARQFNADLAAAARQRLALWDIPEDQIAAIESSGKPLKAVVVRAPIAGTVLEKNAVKGHYVGPETMLYLLGDLSQLWIVADVYEYELGRLDRAGTARITVEGATEPLTGTIDYVYPTVDPTSRTVKVRIVVANPKGDLRPGNFATVELPTRAGHVVQVPEEAVIDTGAHRIVYVALGEGRFRPVEVKTGRRAEGKVEILEGIEAGTEVVVSAQFLIDSESRLRGTSGAPSGHGGH